MERQGVGFCCTTVGGAQLLCLAMSGDTLEMAIVAMIFLSSGKSCLSTRRAYSRSPLIASNPSRKCVPLPIYKASPCANAIDKINTP